MVAAKPDDHRTVTDGLRFPARVGSESSIVGAQAAIEVSAEQVAIWRGGATLALAACTTVRARRTRLSLGTALRLRVDDMTFSVDLSGQRSRMSRWSVLDLLPPFSTVWEV